MNAEIVSAFTMSADWRPRSFPLGAPPQHPGGRRETGDGSCGIPGDGGGAWASVPALDLMALLIKLAQCHRIRNRR